MATTKRYDKDADNEREAGEAAPADDPRRTLKAPPEISPVGAVDEARAAADPNVKALADVDPETIPRFRVPQGFFDGEKLWPVNSEINWHFKYHPSLGFIPLNEAAKKLWDAAKAARNKQFGR